MEQRLSVAVVDFPLFVGGHRQPGMRLDWRAQRHHASFMSKALTGARPAATLIIAHDDPARGLRFLMAQRADSMVFAAGAMVFPGGAVDEEDRVHARSLGVGGELDDLAARVAAIRETIEECGLAIGLHESVSEPATAKGLRDALKSGRTFASLVRDMGLAMDLDGLVPFARWCPPQGREIRRFDTRFYLTVIDGADDGLLPDGTETVGLGWYRARDVLDSAHAGDAKVIFPTRRNLERLAQFESSAELIAHARAHPVSLISPWVEERGGEQHLCIPEGLGYPVTSEPLHTARRG